MARTNYKFKKRQKELKKQKKREEKLLRKHGKKEAAAGIDPDAPEEEIKGPDPEVHTTGPTKDESEP